MPIPTRPGPFIRIRAWNRGPPRHYRVSAINSVGVGDPSTVASGTTDATVPDAPTNLLATAVEATQINLTWTAPSYDGGAAISGYRIEVSQDGAAWADLVSDTRSTVTAFSHTGLQPGSTRFYRVSAINSAGTGMPSAVASASTDDPRERAGRASESILPYAAAAVTASTVSAISARIDAVATGAGSSGEMNTGGFSSLAGSLAGRTGGMDAAGLHMGMGAAGMLLDGASFVLPVRNGQQASPQRGIMSSLATWGGVEYVGLGEPGAAEVDWNGNLLNLHVGADVRVRPDVLAGVAATSSSGSFDFTDKTGENPVAGTYDSRFTTVNPYAAWMIDDAGSVAWASGGYGWGEIELEDARTELRSAGTRMFSGAVGGSHTPAVERARRRPRQGRRVALARYGERGRGNRLAHPGYAAASVAPGVVAALQVRKRGRDRIPRRRGDALRRRQRCPGDGFEVGSGFAHRECPPRECGWRHVAGCW